MIKTIVFMALGTEGKLSSPGILLATLWLSAIAPGAAAPRPEVAGESGGGVTLISHSERLLHELEGLLIHGNGSDITLQVQDGGSDQVKVFHAHSLVLAMQSEVFEDMMLNHNSSILVLKESAECVAVFDKFIRYLYCGDIAVQLDQALPLHKLASRYHVQGLQQGLSQYMIQHLASDSPRSHVVSWYQYATRVGDAKLKDSCLQYLAWNLSSVLHSGEWAIMDTDLLLTLLRRSDLVLHSELELFQALETWMERNQPDAATAEELLRAVRYAMIPPEQLFRLQKRSPVLLKHHESVRDVLYMSYQFHSASPIQLAKYIQVNCSLFTPRNYLSAAWGTQWIISNPTRDDRSTSFHTQMGPSAHDSGKRVTWNALFSPRWLPLGSRPAPNPVQSPGQLARLDGAIPPLAGGTDGRPRLIVTPATASADFAGVTFQKTVLVMARQQGKVVVRNVYNFHQSSEEHGDFLDEADLQRKTSEYLIDGTLHLHIMVKPLYHSLIFSKK